MHAADPKLPACGRSNRIPAKHLSDVGKCGACKAELPPIGGPIEVNNEEQFKEIIRESKVPVLTDFWASWCAMPYGGASCGANCPRACRACSRREGRHGTVPGSGSTIQRPQHS